MQTVILPAVLALFLQGAAPTTVRNTGREVRDVRTAGQCSPILMYSTVKENVSISCNQNDATLNRIVDTLNVLIRDKDLTSEKMQKLLESINSILAFRPQLDRIERNSGAAKSVSEEILASLRKLENNPESSPQTLGEIDGLRSKVEQRARPLPTKVDPDDFVSRISFISLGEKGCPLLGYYGPMPPNPQYKSEVDKGAGAERRHAFSRAVEFFDAAIAMQPNEPAAHFKKAEALCGARRYREALGTIEQAPRAIKGRLDFQKARGQLLFRLGNFRSAVEAFRAARKLDPRDASLAWAEGESLRRSGDCSSAIGAFSSAIRLDPRYTTAYLSRAECRVSLDRPDLAIPDLNTAIGLDETRWEPHRRLAAVYRALAADRALSRQADYRYFADQEERKANELDADATRSTQADTPRLDCQTLACSTHVYYIYFDRNESYLSVPASTQLQKLVDKAAKCRKSVIYLKGFADIGEDNESGGKELADSRASLVSKVILSVLGRKGVMSMTANSVGELIIRTGAESGLLGLIYSGAGHASRPVLAKAVDERNQSVNALLKCAN